MIFYVIFLTFIIVSNLLPIREYMTMDQEQITGRVVALTLLVNLLPGDSTLNTHRWKEIDGRRVRIWNTP